MKISHRHEAGSFGYPTADKMVVELHSKAKTQVKQVEKATMQKPYYLSHFQSEGDTVICSGTFTVFDATTFPHLGVLRYDSKCGGQGLYVIEGKVYLPVHKDVLTGRKESTSWVGKLAYMITDDGNGDTNSWGVSDTEPTGNVKGFVVGRFVEGWGFHPNGITWGSRFVLVDISEKYASYNNPITVMESDTSSCAFDCSIVAFPEIVRQGGHIVDVETNVFSEHPNYEIGNVVTTYTDDGKDIRRTGKLVSLYFTNNNDTYTVTITAEATKDDSCGCGCGDDKCCLSQEFNITTSPYEPATCVPAPAFANYRVFESYRDSDVSTVDKVNSIDIGGTTYSFASSVSVLNANEADLKAAIQDAIIEAGFTAVDVVVNITDAPADGDLATLSVIILSTKAVPVSLVGTLDGSAKTWTFEAI